MYSLKSSKKFRKAGFLPWKHLRAHTTPTMPPYRILRTDTNNHDAGSKRSREAIEAQLAPAKSVRYESSPSICTSPMLQSTLLKAVSRGSSSMHGLVFFGLLALIGNVKHFGLRTGFRVGHSPYRR